MVIQIRRTAPVLAASILLCAMPLASAGESPAAIDENTVRAHMSFLASDALNGRGSGSRDEWIAATYIASQLSRFGLEPLGDDGGFVQTVELSRVVVAKPPTLSAGAVHLKHGEQMVVVALNAAAASGPLQKYRAETPAGKGAVLLMSDWMDGKVPAGTEGTAVLLWRDSPRFHPYWESVAARQITIGPTRIAGLPPDPVRPAASPSQLILSPEAYASIAALADGTAVAIEAESHETGGHTWNAIGGLTGKDSSERDNVILLTAHLDHIGTRETGEDRIFNGADDDASGTIAVLALAEALARGPRPKRTLVFALFGSEEAGGYGATYFVGRPTLPVDRIIANVEFEMIGRPDAKVAPHTLWLTGWERTNLGPQLAAHGARLVADPRPEENFFMRSDNITLARRGIVAQTVSSYGMHTDYHQPSDDFAHIDFAHMTESIQSMLGPIRWLASSAFKPEWRAGGRP